MTVLERINDPRDLRALHKDELLQLCREIREYTVEMVQRTGGHISSSLGTVELTVALHRVFESPRDKIVWDTGHQAYVHKMLTGRRARFDTLRQLGGISGFLVRTESEHDQFGAGHAGTSISAAHGMALARDLKREEWNVVAVIGDGALTAGLAFEGLNNVGHDHRRVIVVLNDNGMSIAPNVGAVSRMLEAVRTATPYRGAKHVVRQVLDHMPAGELAEEARRRIFNSLKALLIPNLLFEQLGFTYFGPVDGHDLFAVENVLAKARDFRDGPVFVHVHTQKGHGYGPAEDDNVKWHGVSATGAAKATAPQYTAVFADAVREILKSDERTVAITAAMPGGTGMLPLFSEFPQRVIDVGICEQHAVTMAAGLATQGIVPVVAIYSTFLQRGFDQVLHDVAVQDLSVVFAMDRAGIVGDDGRTHQGLGVRFPRGTGFGVTIPAAPRELPIGVSETLREGDDLVIIAYGQPVNAALEAAETLAHEGLQATVVNARFAKPLDAERLLALAARTPRFVTVEEHVVAGGFGSAVAELLHERGARVELEMLGIPDEHVDHGAQRLWRRHYGLDAEGIAAAVRGRWPQLVRAHEPEQTAG
ncbi:MAG: 1-deoxy-D-xylulose-5-phosphate synthase [Chloroflexi bacterium]|nr:MAG: 1-deoxy-D-xylulose-5-phosphate synthase [Chloroflexota bacterium]